MGAVSGGCWSKYFFYYEFKFKIFFLRGGGWGRGAVGRGARVSDFIPQRTDEQAQTNLPLQLLRSWGHNNALIYKLYL